MSVGTNENEKIIKENNSNLDKNVENSVDLEKTQRIDMQATQRIDFLGELKKNTEQTILQALKNKQGDIAPNIQESSSEESAELIAQAEKSSQIINSNDVQENPTIIEEQKNEEKIEEKEISEENVDEEVVQEVVQEEIQEENIVQEKNENTQTEEIKEVDESEVIKKKEKQHAQDKKDYRLERMLFERINKMQGKIKESLELIKKFERINAKEENLPNIVTTLHDKLTQEVIKQFRTVGIEFNMKSYLVQAVVSDLLGKFEEGITEFRDCSENLNFVREVQDDFESRVELAPTSKVKNFFARIRGIFKPERKQERLEELERERQEKKLEEANIHLIKYKFINSELERYTIKKNIVNSLTREILHGQGSGLTLNLKEFIDEKIAPEMKKLGLEGLISELEKNIYKEYNEKNNISNEEFEKLPIGQLRKNMKFSKMEIVRNKVSVAVSSNNEDADERMVV